MSTLSSIDLGSIPEGEYYEYIFPVDRSIDVRQLTFSIINGSLPPGLQLVNNFIKGIPNNVGTNTLFTFTIRVEYNGIKSEKVYYITIKNIIPIWTCDNLYFIDTIKEMDYYEHNLLINSELESDRISYSIIKGFLPQGLLIIDNMIQGIPVKVESTAEYEFTIRAKYDNRYEDRTFFIMVENSDRFIWLCNNWTDIAPELGTGYSYIRGINGGTVESPYDLSSIPVSEKSSGNYYKVSMDGWFKLSTSSAFYVNIGANLVWNNQGTIDIVYNTIPEQEYFEYDFLLDSTLDQDSLKLSLITGELPPGLSIYNNKLIGIPDEVYKLSLFKFVIRATYGLLISDRTFYVYIDGPDVPEWITAEGLLSVGPNNSLYILDESYIDFQLLASDPDTIAGQELQFWIASDGGVMPPGLTLSKTGRIYGWVKPLLADRPKEITGYYDTVGYDSKSYDYGTITTNGYDDFGYDMFGYDFSNYYQAPKKLNRNYEFIVTISDGNTSVQRKFKIYVVGDDSFVVDTTQLVSSTETITADVTSLRAPVWITPEDLGYRRANNYQTIKLDVYDIASNAPVFYSLDTTNPDGTNSVLPPVLEFDSTTSEIFGVIPYQPANTKTYNFTITATRIGKLRQIPMVSDSSQYPLKVNDIEVSRDSSLESSTVIRAYSSENYVENVSGIVLYKVSALSSWTYINNDTNVEYYSNTGAINPWDINTWYNELLLINVVSGPSIVVIEPSTNIYSAYYETAESKRTFTLKVIGEIETSIVWLSDNDLGEIEAELPSTLYVKAIGNTDNNTIQYELISGELPPGLIFDSFGQITGKVNQFEYPSLDSNRIFEFTVQATDSSNLAQSSKTFKITVNTPNQVQFSNIIVKPSLKPAQRLLFTDFITDSDIFETESIYRPGDDTFGVQTHLEMLVFAGIETKSAVDFISMVGQNHKRKSFKFGDIKSAQGIIPGTHNVVYEVIYIQMIDPLEIDGAHLDYTIKTSPDNFPYTIDNNKLTIDGNNIIAVDSYHEYKQPSSISLWRHRIKELGLRDRHYLPLWMRSIQPGSYEEIDYQSVIPLCYCKPGTSENILLNIKNSGFDFKQIEYDIDRYIINAVEGYNENKYIFFNYDRIKSSYSIESAIEEEIVRATNAEDEILRRLNSEITRAIGAENSIPSLLTQPISLRLSADVIINDNINSEITRASAIDAILEVDIDAEITRATNADATLAANLNAEITRATNADATLTSNLNAEITRATNADITLAANLNTEITRAVGAKSTLTANINAEKTRATNAEVTLTSNLKAEKFRAINAKTALTSRINAEKTRANSAEATINANLNTEISRANNAQLVLTTNLNAEITRATAAEASMSGVVFLFGNVFEYIGTVAGGASSGTAYNLSSLSQQSAGDYYTIITSGWFIVGIDPPFYANAQDGLVWNASGGIDLIDNSNPSLTGTVDEISVTGSIDDGYIVGIDDTFKTRLSTAESWTPIDSSLAASLNAEISRALSTEGSLQASIDLLSNALSLPYGKFEDASLITSTTDADQVVAEYSITSFRILKVLIQISSGTSYQCSELLIIHDGTSADISEYNIITTDVELATYSADISGGNVRLLVTPINAISEIKAIIILTLV